MCVTTTVVEFREVYYLERWWLKVLLLRFGEFGFNLC